MALITVGAVVNVALHAPVVRVRLTLGVAIGAREYEIVCGVRVAGRAHTVGIAVIGREPRVIENRAQP